MELLKALNQFKKQYPSITSADLQTFILGWNAYEAACTELIDFTEMVKIPSGSFQMGSNEGDSNEKPIHIVRLNGFYMSKYEVTQAQWKEIMGTNPSKFKGDNLPVEKVSWNAVQKFIKKFNDKTGKKYRLPTEAEWEYAARGGENYKYAGSNNINNVAVYEKNSYDLGSSSSAYGTHPVGSKQVNGYGLYDMTGNVWEWCSDYYKSDYYSSSPTSNPENTVKSSFRVIRGGSWYYDAMGWRVANRNFYSADSRGHNIGFRLACSL